MVVNTQYMAGEPQLPQNCRTLLVHVSKMHVHVMYGHKVCTCVVQKQKKKVVLKQFNSHVCIIPHPLNLFFHVLIKLWSNAIFRPSASNHMNPIASTNACQIPTCITGKILINFLI